MNSLRPFVATALILGTVTSTSAQSDQNLDAWSGIQATLGEFVLDTFEDVGASYQEAVRHYWLTTNDITMTMKTHDERWATPLPLDNSLVLFMWEGSSDGAVYAKFDWDNLAMSMRVSDSGQQGGIDLGGGEINVPLLDADSEATDVTMYFDAGGNVYVPYTDGHLTGPMEQGPIDLLNSEVVRETVPHIRVNLPDFVAGMMGVLEFSLDLAIESRVADMVDDYLLLLIGSGVESGAALEGLRSYLETTGPENNEAFFGDLDLSDQVEEFFERASPNSVTEELEYDLEYDLDAIGPLERRLVEVFTDLVQARYDALVNFPMVNFAFLFSPTWIRAEAERRGIELDEESVTWNNMPGATRITVDSGEDKGYVFIFDGAGRLVLLRDTNGDTAEYNYDRDLTVRLPANILTVQDLM